MRFAAAAALLVAGLLAPPSVQPAYAQTITVTTTAEAPGASGDCTLGEAIQAANSNALVDGCAVGNNIDVIELAPGATYTLTAAASDESALLVDSIIVIQGHGARLAHDPLAGTLRFFSMTASSNLTLVNLSLTGGLAHGQNGIDGPAIGVSGTAGGQAFGGAIYSWGGDIGLDGVTFQGNSAQGGRGGSGFAGSSTSYGADGGWGFGGAIHISGTGSVFLQGAGAHFTGNQALGGRGGDGGIFTTAAGKGGGAVGGAIDAYAVDASAAPLNADNNAAQGGDGGNGASLGNGSVSFGGALYVVQLSLANATFTNNRAVGGHAGDSVLSNPSMRGGDATGGAFWAGIAVLSHISIISNTAQGGAGPTGGNAYGGGMYVSSAPLSGGWQNARIMSNTVAGGPGSDPDSQAGQAAGGGAYLSYGILQMKQSAVVGNAALAGADPGSVTVTSGLGGGLFFIGGAVVTNTTIALNRADEGGGLESRDGVTLTHVTVYSNTTNNGGALDMLTSAGSINLRNSLVAYNAGGNCNATITVAGANLQYPGNSCAGVTTGDPRLLPVADNGGQTLTAALRRGSPAIDAGDPAYCPPTDQRGFRRPVGAGCDLGAYERWLDFFLPLLKR